MVNMTAAITESSIFQKIGLDIKREAARAPKPIVENQTTLATAPPIAKNQRSSSN